MRLPGFPPEAATTIAASPVAEFATTTAAGMPLDTPLLAWVSDDGTTVDLSTGLSYPVKAERARRRPTVGLCFAGHGSGPVVAMEAVASVRDSNIQNNAERYVGLSGTVARGLAGGRPWSEARKAVWYWSRIWMLCAPVRVLTWSDGLEKPPLVWQREGPPVKAQSDPPPATPRTKSPHWPVKEWRDTARSAIENLPSPYLTAIDADGAPLPFPTPVVELTDDGFELDVAAGAPWNRTGPASLCFDGRATFVGRLDGSRLVVERQLPDLPLVTDPRQIVAPPPELRETLMERLLGELERRNQPVPDIPTEAPPGFTDS